MDIDHVALLARLKLSEDEKTRFSRQVGSLIDYIDKLSELDTGGTEPTAHVLPIKNVFREDALQPSLPREQALQNSPGKDERYYRVPKIID